MNDTIKVLTEFLDRPVAYHPILAKALGSVPAAVILSQGVYWWKIAKKDGKEWFWVTADEWFNQTGVSEESQLTARRILKQSGFWEEKLIGLPAKMHYKIDVEVLVAVISRYLETGIPVAVDNRNKKRQSARASDGTFRQQETVQNGDKKTNTDSLKIKEEISYPAAIAPDSQSPKVKVEILPVEDGKNGTASRGPATQAKSWSNRAATIFDQVNADLSKAERIECLPFDWKVCRDENFNQLKNLKKIIDDGFPSKNEGRQPTDSQLDDCFRLIFTKAWHYFRKIQKDKGGAFHYNPTSVYKSYNTIKTFMINGNINGSPATGTTFGSGIDHNGTFDKTRGY